LKPTLISVIIVSYNVRDLLLTCIESLFEFTTENALEVIVVDNASTDKSCDEIAKKFPKVKIIHNSLNNGFPAANNQAFMVASGDFILMLNPDTECFDTSIDRLCTVLKKNKSIALVAPRLLNTNRTTQQSVWRFPTVFSIFCELFFLNFLNGKHSYADMDLNNSFEAQSFSGAALLFRKELLDKSIWMKQCSGLKILTFVYAFTITVEKCSIFQKLKSFIIAVRAQRKTTIFHFQIRYSTRLNSLKKTTPVFQHF
jgi:GT2 family glycosyltransferase